MSLPPLVSIAAVLALAATPAPTPRHKLSGRVVEVVDRDEKGIVGVQVQLYRRDSPLPDPATSHKDGRYEAPFDEGETIETVRYDHPDYLLAIVEDISGRSDHQLTKTLFLNSRAATLTLDDIAEVTCAFERALALDRASDRISQNAKQFRYAESLAALKIGLRRQTQSETRKQLEGRLAAVEAAYVSNRP
jgi:hypothetical protein